MLSVMAASGSITPEFRNGMSEIGVSGWRWHLRWAGWRWCCWSTGRSMRFWRPRNELVMAIAMLLLLFVRLLFSAGPGWASLKPRILVLGTGSQTVKVDEVSQARFGGGVGGGQGSLFVNMTPPRGGCLWILPEDESLLTAVENTG